MEKEDSVLIDPHERVLAVMGNGVISQLISKQELSSHQAVLTDKRIYFAGNSLVRSKGGYTKINEARTVDLKDVTGSGMAIVASLKPLVIMAGLLLVALMMILPALSCMFGPDAWMQSQSGKNLNVFLLACGCCLVLMALIALCVYFLRKQTLFIVCYADEQLAIDLRLTTKKTVRRFHWLLRQAKDVLSGYEQEIPLAAPPSKQPTA